MLKAIRLFLYCYHFYISIFLYFFTFHHYTQRIARIGFLIECINSNHLESYSIRIMFLVFSALNLFETRIIFPCFISGKFAWHSPNFFNQYQLKHLFLKKVLTFWWNNHQKLFINCCLFLREDNDFRKERGINKKNFKVQPSVDIPKDYGFTIRD